MKTHSYCHFSPLLSTTPNSANVYIEQPITTVIEKSKAKTTEGNIISEHEIHKLLFWLAKLILPSYRKQNISHLKAQRETTKANQ